MRINILDPGMLHPGGHHAWWNRRLAKSLQLLGHDVLTYGSNELAPLVRNEFADCGGAEPLFTVNPYVAPQSVDPVSGELTLFIDGAAVLTSELSRLRSADLWLWPTLFATQYFAVTSMATVPMNAGCIHNQPDFEPGISPAFWRYAAQAARRHARRFGLGVTGPRLREEYAHLLGDKNIAVLPTCYEYLGEPPAHHVLRKVGFFGYQRGEKGLNLLDPLIGRLLDSGLEVLLHDSSGTLSAPPRRGLEVIGYLPDLSTAVSQCDLVVVLQDPTRYRLRESGIAMDAIAAGVPLIVARGTASEARIRDFKTGGTYAELRLDCVLEAIALCQMHYAALATSAGEAARRWAAQHGGRRFALSMLQLAGIHETKLEAL